MSPTTWAKIEKGSPSVSMGNYAKALHQVGLLESLVELTDPKADQTGMLLDEERLPKRVRLKQRKTQAS